MSLGLAEYRKLLVRISRELTGSNFKDLCYLAEFSAREIEAVRNDSTQYFIYLEQKRKISKSNLSFLEKSLEEIQRHDLAQMIASFAMHKKSAISSLQNEKIVTGE